MGVFTIVEHSPVWFNEHKGALEPEYGWQTKNIGYGDKVRITDDGRVEQLFAYDGFRPWVDVRYHGKAYISGVFPMRHYVEYEFVFEHGLLVDSKLVREGPIEEVF